ncbi:hypothetical protein CKM354_000674900 [Cercospora kikuchii]|uniref:SET domain-containing protein n=1 Tax=Cercospora kikuchii TaxID=84275 RepID=A0A9P3CPQ8_9PEZI|nr:uncharacterized protein CKM354_000674900 [Cercospora kikuchii]GIZ43525.1 hypothetical protein CKM354_000674900 [Cercospora kikuchii]
MAQAGPLLGNGVYYEIRNAGRKGRGAFALRNISAGTRILIDHPLFVIEKDEKDIRVDDILSKLSALSPTARRHFESLPFAPQYNAAPTDMQHYGRFHLNNFSMLGTAWGCFVHASRFNNSCLPNCTISQTKNGGLQIFVARSVSQGEELTFAYAQTLQYMTTDERQELLRHLLDGSACICELCSLPADQRVLSDMRRKIIRHLAFILRDGTDLEGGAPGQVTSSSFCPHPTFENLSEPAGYFVALAEAEGIGGLWVWNVYAKGVGELLKHFRTRTRQLPASVLRTMGTWMRRACDMKAKFVGTTDVARQANDDRFDWLTGAVGLLERTGGLLDAVGL